MSNSIRQIGELLLRMIDDMEKGDRKQYRDVTKDTSHYLEQLVSESLSEARRIYLGLQNRLLSHQSIRGAASEITIKAELLSLLRSNQNREKIRRLSPEQAGQQILDSLVSKKSLRLVVFPLRGLLPEFKGLTVGNAMFATYERILEIAEVPRYQPPGNDASHAEEKLQTYRIAADYEEENLRTISVGTTVRACDRRAAVYLAEKQINLSLNILRLLLPLVYKTLNRPTISIYDIGGVSRASVITLSDGAREIFFHDLASLTQVIYPSAIGMCETAKAVEHANQIYSRYPDNLTLFEGRILSAIIWAGEGIDAIEKDIKVVKCVIALEVLFKLGDNKQVQFRRAVRQLFDYKDVDANMVERHAKQIYKTRSAVVHGGKREVDDEEAVWAERIACGCILRSLEMVDKFQTELEFQNWLGIQKAPRTIWGRLLGILNLTQKKSKR